jgi:hypothetical protein|tara:strand:- start:28 stop:399 length:372 start_codon:yes stop_codon:yes gene_type:complete
MPRKQTKKRSVKARSPIMTRSRARKAAEEAKTKPKTATRPRKGAIVIITSTKRGAQGQLGKVADYSTDGKRVGLITLYNSQFFVSLVEDVRKLTPAESKKKRPQLRREATLDSMEYNILNDRY